VGWLERSARRATAPAADTGHGAPVGATDPGAGIEP
jgi:hypothetical protein